jgi:hypothetical protein
VTYGKEHLQPNSQPKTLLDKISSLFNGEKTDPLAGYFSRLSVEWTRMPICGNRVSRMVYDANNKEIKGVFNLNGDADNSHLEVAVATSYENSCDYGYLGVKIGSFSGVFVLGTQIGAGGKHRELFIVNQSVDGKKDCRPVEVGSKDWEMFVAVLSLIENKNDNVREKDNKVNGNGGNSNCRSCPAQEFCLPRSVS